MIILNPLDLPYGRKVSSSICVKPFHKVCYGHCFYLVTFNVSDVDHVCFFSCLGCIYYTDELYSLFKLFYSFFYM